MKNKIEIKEMELIKWYEKLIALIFNHKFHDFTLPKTIQTNLTSEYYPEGFYYYKMTCKKCGFVYVFENDDLFKKMPYKIKIGCR